MESNKLVKIIIIVKRNTISNVKWIGTNFPTNLGNTAN